MIIKKQIQIINNQNLWYCGAVSLFPVVNFHHLLGNHIKA